MNSQKIVLDLFDQADNFRRHFFARIFDNLQRSEERFTQRFVFFVLFQIFNKFGYGVDGAGDFFSTQTVANGNIARFGALLFEKAGNRQVDKRADGSFQLRHRIGIAIVANRFQPFHDFLRCRFRRVGRIAAARFGRSSVEKSQMRFFFRGKLAGQIACGQTVHHAAQKIHAFEQQIDKRRSGSPFARADFAQNVFHNMGEILDIGKVEKAGIALDRMDGPENAVNNGHIVRIGFQCHEQWIQTVKNFLTFRYEVLQQSRIDAAHIRG